VAAPSGEYTYRATLDASPIFGTVDGTDTIALRRPGPDALARRFAELDSRDERVRLAAVMDLPYFRRKRDDVAIRLIRMLDDPSTQVALIAEGSLASLGPCLTRRTPELAKIVAGEAGVGVPGRCRAAPFLARFGTMGPETVQAIATLTESEDPALARAGRAALAVYKTRTAPGSSDG